MQSNKKGITLLSGALLILGFFGGRACSPGSTGSPGSQVESAKSAGPVVWTCSMHPQVRLPDPVPCPICFMDLIVAPSGGGANLGPTTLAMTDAAAALAEIETAPVERRDVSRPIHLVGSVEVDETRISYITAWVEARLEKVFVDSTGVNVREGDHLVELYSSTLLSAQQILLHAIDNAKQIEASSIDVLKASTKANVDSARAKLRLLGMVDHQIDELIDRGEAIERLVLHAPTDGVVLTKAALQGQYVDEGDPMYTIADLSRVWVLLDAYESDLAWLRFGQEATFTVLAYPGESFTGRVAYIDRILDTKTHTVNVRLNVDNPDLRLKPGMFVSGTVRGHLASGGQVVDRDLVGKWSCSMHPEVIADEVGACPECGMDLRHMEDLGFVSNDDGTLPLVIPASAPLFTGRRSVVYVKGKVGEATTYEGREVVLGPRAGDWYVVAAGLQEGEQVVTHGNFKLDSELQIRAKNSMMNPAADMHASAVLHPKMVKDAPKLTPALAKNTPVVFQQQLGAVLDKYLAVPVVLALDKEAKAEIEAMWKALQAVDMKLLEGEVHRAWMAGHQDLMDKAKAVLDAEGLEARRAAFSPFTEAFIPVLESFGYLREGAPVGIFHCPMAFGDTGANWIQAEERTANPYEGSRMYRCGSRTRFLSEDF
ncbi:MAG: efflux RND transporter periplasmic adaptor subunit [Planctomycetota bacterium]|nr:efflux RND transporter periplasmic adaptor subunit [Planctomycetota bacterium]